MLRVAEDPDDRAGHVDLDDVAAVHALLDAVAQLPDENRRGNPSHERFAASLQRGRTRP